MRGVQWRVNLGVLPSGPAPIDELRRAAADCRRRYAELRRKLLVDPHLMEDGQRPSQSHIDNPLSLDPDSIWGRFFRNAELEKVIDKDLTRLYPENGIFFQSPACQAMLRRILLVWSLIHPQASYRQGMHELLAPLVYVLHVDVSHLEQVKRRYEELFDDRFDSCSSRNLGMERAFNVAFPGANECDTTFSDSDESGSGNEEATCDLFRADADVQVVVLGSDSYGAEGELGALLSTRFLEHDAYGMFDALLSGNNGAVVMADYFQNSTGLHSPVGQPPVLEASAAVYHLLAAVDLKLHIHLVELGVEPQFFALRWLRLLFGREFSLDELLVMWDAIFTVSNTPLVSEEGYDDSSDSTKISPRSALISAIAVSMLLYVGPALLASPDATGCLQRLLNFPQIPDVQQFINNAKLLQPTAQTSSRNPSRSVYKIPQKHENKRILKQRSGSISPPTFQAHLTPGALRHQRSAPCSPDLLRMALPENYWEEKWWTHSVLRTVPSGDNPQFRESHSTARGSSGGAQDSIARFDNILEDQQHLPSGNTQVVKEELVSKQIGESGDQTEHMVTQLSKPQGLRGLERISSSDDEGGKLVQHDLKSGHLDGIQPEQQERGEGTLVSCTRSPKYKVTLSIAAEDMESANIRKDPADILPAAESLLSKEPRVCENATDSSITRQLQENICDGEAVHASGMQGKVICMGRARKALFTDEQEKNVLEQPGADVDVQQLEINSRSLCLGISDDNINSSPLADADNSQGATEEEENVNDELNSAIEETEHQLKSDIGLSVGSVSQILPSTPTISRSGNGSQEAPIQNAQVEFDPNLLEKAKSASVTYMPLNLSWVWNFGKRSPIDKIGSSGASSRGITDLEIAAGISAPDLLTSKPMRWWQSGLEVSSTSSSPAEISSNRLGFGSSQPPCKGPSQSTMNSVICEKSSSTREKDAQRSTNSSLEGTVSDLPTETDPMRSGVPRCTAYEETQLLEREGFNEPMIPDDGSMGRGDNGDVFEKHIVSEVPRHASAGGTREAVGDMAEKQPGSGPLDLARRLKDKGASVTLQLLGHSMLEHIQVLESLFSPCGPVSDNDQLLKPVLGGRGHVAALVALAELRKISSALQQV